MAHVGALLNEAQKNAASHPRLLKAMQRCIGADAAGVAAALRQGTDIVLLAEKQDPLVDRTLNFIAKACALHPSVLAPAFLEHAVSRIDSKDRFVRLRACCGIAAVLEALPEDADIADSVWDATTQALLARAKDKIAGVRCAAARSLARLQSAAVAAGGSGDGDEGGGGSGSGCPVHAQLLSLLHHDSSKDVRLAALQALVVASDAAREAVLLHTRDTSPEVRLAAYAKLSSQVQSALLTPVTRAALLATGLSDDSPAVRQAATVMMACWMWLEAPVASASGGGGRSLDLCELVHSLDVVTHPQHERVAEAALYALYAWAEGAAPSGTKGARVQAVASAASVLAAAAEGAVVAGDEDEDEEGGDAAAAAGEEAAEAAAGAGSGKAKRGKGASAAAAAAAASPAIATSGLPAGVSALELWSSLRAGIASTLPHVSGIDVEGVLYLRTRAAWLTCIPTLAATGDAGFLSAVAGAGAGGLLVSRVPYAQRAERLDELLPSPQQWAELVAHVSLEAGMGPDHELLGKVLQAQQQAAADKVGGGGNELLRALQTMLPAPDRLVSITRLPVPEPGTTAMLRQVLIAGQLLDFGDEVGRTAALSVLIQLLPLPILPPDLVPTLLHTLAVVLGCGGPVEAAGYHTAGDCDGGYAAPPAGGDGAASREAYSTLGQLVGYAAVTLAAAGAAASIGGGAASGADGADAGADSVSGLRSKAEHLRQRLEELMDAADAATGDASAKLEKSIADVKRQLEAVEDELADAESAAATGKGSSRGKHVALAGGAAALHASDPAAGGDTRTMFPSEMAALYTSAGLRLMRAFMQGNGLSVDVATTQRHCNPVLKAGAVAALAAWQEGCLQQLADDGVWPEAPLTGNAHPLMHFVVQPALAAHGGVDSSDQTGTPAALAAECAALYASTASSQAAADTLASQLMPALSPLAAAAASLEAAAAVEAAAAAVRATGDLLLTTASPQGGVGAGIAALLAILDVQTAVATPGDAGDSSVLTPAMCSRIVRQCAILRAVMPVLLTRQLRVGAAAEVEEEEEGAAGSSYTAEVGVKAYAALFEALILLLAWVNGPQVASAVATTAAASGWGDAAGLDADADLEGDSSSSASSGGLTASRAIATVSKTVRQLTTFVTTYAALSRHHQLVASQACIHAMQQLATKSLVQLDAAVMQAIGAAGASVSAVGKGRLGAKTTAAASKAKAGRRAASTSAAALTAAASSAFVTSFLGIAGAETGADAGAAASGEGAASKDDLMKSARKPSTTAKRGSRAAAAGDDDEDDDVGSVVTLSAATGSVTAAAAASTPGAFHLANAVRLMLHVAIITPLQTPAAIPAVVAASSTGISTPPRGAPSTPPRGAGAAAAAAAAGAAPASTAADGEPLLASVCLNASDRPSACTEAILIHALGLLAADAASGVGRYVACLLPAVAPVDLGPVAKAHAPLASCLRVVLADVLKSSVTQLRSAATERALRKLADKWGLDLTGVPADAPGATEAKGVLGAWKALVAAAPQWSSAAVGGATTSASTARVAVVRSTASTSAAAGAAAGASAAAPAAGARKIAVRRSLGVGPKPPVAAAAAAAAPAAAAPAAAPAAAAPAAGTTASGRPSRRAAAAAKAKPAYIEEKSSGSDGEGGDGGDGSDWDEE